jgi:tetratricopeptide (TPR) repeat protein
MGLGCAAIVGWARDAARRLRVPEGAVPALLAGILALSPAWVVARSFEARDRSDNYFAYDYAWNILTSLEQDAILFTNGDNDTFPLWFLQEVEGVRKDVRVANLALLNTPWYNWQLKNLEPKVPFDLTDAEIDELRPYRTRDGEIVSVKDQAVIEIARANRWRRPLYFAVTVPDLMGLDERKLIQLEGLVYRARPAAQEDFVDAEKTSENLWSRYRYRGILTPAWEVDARGVRDWNEEKLIANYSAAFSRLAIQLRNEGRVEEAIRAMETAARISPGHRAVEGLLGPLYAEAGRYDKAESVFTSQLRQHPDSLSARLGLAFVRDKQGRRAEADSLYSGAVRMAPEHREARLRLAHLRLRGGDLEAGARTLREWLSVDPGDSEVVDELRGIERAMGRADTRAAPRTRVERGSGGTGGEDER